MDDKTKTGIRGEGRGRHKRLAENKRGMMEWGELQRVKRERNSKEWTVAREK